MEPYYDYNSFLTKFEKRFMYKRTSCISQPTKPYNQRYKELIEHIHTNKICLTIDEIADLSIFYYRLTHENVADNVQLQSTPFIHNTLSSKIFRLDRISNNKVSNTKK